MRRRTWIPSGVLGLAGWAAIGLGLAHAGVIPRVDTVSPYSPLALMEGTLSVSIYKPVAPMSTNVDDVTDTWLPEVTVDPVAGVVTGKDVYVVINKMVGGTQVPQIPDSIGLIDVNPPSPPFNSTTPNTTNPFLNPTTLTTSRYRGVCTNFGANTDTSLDFNFNPIATTLTVSTSTIGLVVGSSVSGFKLTPTDCGGMAVITATVSGVPATFIAPRDTDADGTPDIAEARYCPATAPNCLTATTDTDTGPVSGSPIGDGIATFDEVTRGFIVSGSQLRTDPTQKDLFVHLVNPQCLPDNPDGTVPDPLTSTASLLGQPSGAPSATIYPTDGTPLFGNLNSLISGTQMHPLGHTPGGTHYTTNEWVDKFFRFTLANGTQYTSGASITTTAPPEDRQINLNALFALFDAVTGFTIQKGVRFIECVAPPPPTSPLGLAGLQTPNGSENAFLFTQRIVQYLTNSTNGLITKGGTRKVRYSTFMGGAWITPMLVPDENPANPTGDGDPTNPTVRNFIISKAIQFYLAMEGGGHSTILTPEVMGTRTTSYGHHWAPFTGSNVDYAITNKVDKATSGFNTFYIPTLYNNSDQQDFILHSTPP